MKISFHTHFTKAYRKLPQKLQIQVDERLTLFITNPFHPQLNNHKLRGEYQSYRSIDITGNYRALFKMVAEDHAFFKIVGTHHQLYHS